MATNGRMSRDVVKRLTVTPPSGLRLSEKLLRDYRQLQAHLAAPQLDRLGRDPVAEKLTSRIMQATDLFPWTPPEVVRWVYAWLHVLAFGQQAKGCRHFYGSRKPERVDWVLKYPDRAELDDADWNRH